jgi:RNA polymerase sigma-70 factor (ECF subfamily)
MDLDVTSDFELLQRLRLFEQQTLAQVYDTYSPGLYRYAVRRLGDVSLAEDCVAETFSRLLQAIQAQRGPQNFLKAYLYRVAHNWISDYFRREPFPHEELTEIHPDVQANPEEEANFRNKQERLRSAIRRLTPEQQQVIILKYLEGWENEEIAHAMKKPAGAVKSLQHRALASLNRLLRNESLI